MVPLVESELLPEVRDTELPELELDPLLIPPVTEPPLVLPITEPLILEFSLPLSTVTTATLPLELDEVELLSVTVTLLALLPLESLP